ncbi:MAG: CCA tRNA nucleotidyltransferase [Rickettsiaceae bacterium]|nr:CCA tRNA nucleotidyltransferase [Rickettsiaceae bacterium]
MKIIQKELKFESHSLNLILKALSSAGLEARLVGGCVRDALIGKRVVDIDIAVAGTPDKISKILTKENFNIFRILPEFGIIMVAVGNEVFEIASLRKDIKCYGRRADVEFTNDFALDSNRRDFTINALSYDVQEQKIYDYQGGIDDLHNKQVKFIGRAEDKIKEDYSRILRFFRFSSCYANDIDAEGYKACVENKKGLEMISRFTINKELDKIIMSPKCSLAIAEIEKAGINTFGKLKLKELPQPVGHRFLETEYAILFSNNPSDKVKTQLKKFLFPKRLVDAVTDIISIKEGDDINFELLKRWEAKCEMEKYVEFATKLNLINEQKRSEFLNTFSSSAPVFPITSHYLMNLGITGKKLGETISLLKNSWIKSGFSLSKSELLNMLGK